MNKSHFIVLIGIIAVLCLVCSQPTEIEYGTLVVGIHWGTISGGSLKTGTISTDRAEADRPQISVRILQEPVRAAETVEPSKIRFTLQPGSLIFEFEEIEEAYTIQAELGIYNLMVEVFDESGKIIYGASYNEILIEPNKTSQVELTLEPNFPASAPRFVGLLPVNVSSTGSYTLQWTSVQGAETYTLHEDDDSTFASPVVSYTGPDTTCSISDRQDGKYFYRVQAGSAIGASPWSSSAVFQVLRTSALILQTDSLPDGMEGSSYSASICAEGGVYPYHWEVTAGSLPPGLNGTQNGCYQVTGDPTSAGTFNFTVQVTDSSSPEQSVSKQFSISISAPVPPLSITTTSLSAGQAGQLYSESVHATGGTMPYTWSISSGALPDGLSLDGYTGVISGTPATPGIFTFTILLTDNGDPNQSVLKQFSITLTDVTPALWITTASLPSGRIGQVYSEEVSAAGGTTPYTWSVSSGTLPDGLSVDLSTGVISGTPITTGTYDFTLQVEDTGVPRQFDTQVLSIVIHLPVLSITTESLPDGQVDQVYSQEFSATGGLTPYTWSVSSGTLPDGLSVIPSTGVIHGTPSAAGTFDFTIQATDHGIPQQTETKNLSITINPATLTITTVILPDGQAGQPYDQMVSAAGGTTPYAWSISSGALPDGLSLDPSTGAINGAPATTGTFNFTVQVTDAGSPPQSGTQNLAITIHPALLDITTASLPAIKAGTAYYKKLDASGGTPPYSWTEISRNPAYLAEGIHFSSHGSLEGTVYSQPHSGQITLRVTDSGGPPQTDTRTYNLNVLAGDLELLTAYLPDGQVDFEYWGYITYRLGTPPLKRPWTITGSLPPGLSYDYSGDNYQLSISGWPSSAGTYNFSVTIRDSSSPQKTRTDSFTLTIN